jgi:hypothetical protein
MKKLLVGAIVGGIIIFLWQFLSFAALDLHREAQQYTLKQDTLLAVLRANLAEGRYYLPTVPETATNDEEVKAMEQMVGKDWAVIDYHAKYEDTMVMNMVRGLLTNIIIVFLLCWIITRGGPLSFGKIFLCSVFTGFIAFLNFPYTDYIWYNTPGIWPHFVDAVLPWAITGAWLGWWLNRK